jgi:hypothetical protein
MDLLSELVEAEMDSDTATRLSVARADMRTLHACLSAGWLEHSQTNPAGFKVTEAGFSIVSAGLVSNATGKVNIRVPDALRAKVDAKNARIGTTTTAVIIDALRRYVGEKDETSALRLKARIAPDIRAARAGEKAEL